MLLQASKNVSIRLREPTRSLHPATAAVRHQPRLQCRASSTTAVPSTQLALHCGETTLQMPFSPQQAQTLDAALSKLLQTFAEKQAATRPKRWESMEVRFSSEQPDQGLELLEVFCNPNTYKTAFDAKLMITARSAGLKVVCEGRLSNLKADLDSFIKDHCD